MINAIYSATFNLEGLKCPFCSFIVSNCKLDDFVEVPHKPLLQTWLCPRLSVAPFHFQRLETVVAFCLLGWKEIPPQKAPLPSYVRRISRMKVMHTYMRGDFVCCQSHDEILQWQWVQAGCVLVPWGVVTGFIMKRKPQHDPAVPTFFNFWGQFNESSTGLLLMRLTLTFIAK